jgi:uncharacterized protein YbjT (DUF2867 family)
MSSTGRKRIAVIGAIGQQGGAVMHALQARGQFTVRPDGRSDCAREQGRRWATDELRGVGTRANFPTAQPEAK